MIFHTILYIVLLAGIAALNVVNDFYVVYVIDMIFVAMSIFSLITTLILRFNTDAEFVSENVIAEKGGVCNLRIKITNKSFLPVTNCRVKVVIKSKYTHKTVKKIKIMCQPKSSEQYTVDFDCTHCELISAEFIKIHTSDYLGFFPMTRFIRKTARVIVMPQLPDTSITDMMFSQISDDENITYSKNKSGDDPTEIFDIREYKAGDNIKNIHWKLSAKTDKTMLKENGLPLVTQDTVIFDVFDDSTVAKKEELYELFYGLIYAMTKRGYGFEMRYCNEEYIAKRIENQTDIYALFADIYRIKPYSRQSQAAADYYAASETGGNNRIFYMTDRLDSATLKRLEYLCGNKNAYYLIPGELDGHKLPVKFG